MEVQQIIASPRFHKRVQAKAARCRSGQSASRRQEEPSKIPMPLNWRVPPPLLGKHPTTWQEKN